MRAFIQNNYATYRFGVTSLDGVACVHTALSSHVVFKGE